MAVIVDRFNVLRDRIQNSTQRRVVREKLRREAENFGYRVRQELIKEAPSGEQWEEPAEVFNKRRTFNFDRSPRASLRQHGITLEQGWSDPDVDFRGSTTTTITASMTISNTAPQAEWVIDGTPAHPIPRSPSIEKRLYFYSFMDRVVRAPFIVDHPGQEPNPFADRVLNEQTQRDLQRFRQVASDILDPIRELFNE